MDLSQAPKQRPEDRSDASNGASVLRALPPRDTGALVRSVREQLRLAIILEEIPPGTRLNQVQLAAQLGVSRMPVRAASAELVNEGLLVPIPSGGLAVRALTRADVEAAYHVREALEVQAARDVADRRPVEPLKRMFGILADHEALGGANDTRALLELDRRFHMTMLDATENPYFGLAMVPMWAVVERAMVGMLRTVPDMFNLAWQQHREIAEALQDGDGALAQEKVHEHLQHACVQFTANRALYPED